MLTLRLELQVGLPDFSDASVFPDDARYVDPIHSKCSPCKIEVVTF